MKNYLFLSVFATGVSLLGQGCKPKTNPAIGTSAHTDPSIVVTSENEPKSDADALAMVALTMTPAPSVIYRAFINDMYDSMDLVIQFPKERLAEFWELSGWSESGATYYKGLNSEDQEQMKSELEFWVKQFNSTELKSLPQSNDFIHCIGQNGNDDQLKAYVFLDQAPNDIIIFFQWVEL